MLRSKFPLKKLENYLHDHFFYILNEVLLICSGSLGITLFIFYNTISENEFIRTNELDVLVRTTAIRIFTIALFGNSLLSIVCHYLRSLKPNVFFLYRAYLVLCVFISFFVLLWNYEVRSSYVLFFSFLFFFDVCVYFLIKNLFLLSCIKDIKIKSYSNYLALVIALIFLVFFINVELIKTYMLQKAFDVGIYANVLYRLSTDFDSYCAITDQNFFRRTHFSPILLPLVPIYYLIPNPIVLLIIQDVLLVSAGLTLYKVSALMTREKKFSLVLMLAFFLNPLLNGVVNYDFHELAFFPFLFLLFVYFIEKEKLYIASIVLLFVLFVKEDIALHILPFSLYIFYRLKNIRYTLFYIFFCLAYFIIVTRVYMEATMIDRFGGVIANGFDGFGGIFTTFISNPVYVINYVLKNDNKVIYLLVIFFSSGLLAFRTKHFLFLLIPASFIHLLTWMWSQYSFHFQYGAVILPIVFFLAILGYKKSKKEMKYGIFGVLLFNSLMIFTFFSPLRSVSLKISDELKENYQSMLSFVKNIPEDKSLSASPSLLPWVSSRDTLYNFPTIKNSDYVLVNLNDGPWPLSSKKAVFDTLRFIEQQLNYKITQHHSNGFVLLEKKLTASSTVFLDLTNPSKRKLNLYSLKTQTGKIKYDESSESKLVLSNKNPDLKSGILVHGPIVNINSGRSRLIFNLKSPQKGNHEHPVGYIDIFDSSGIILKKEIFHKDIVSGSTYRKLEVDLFLNKVKTDVEFRIHCNDSFEVLFDNVYFE